MTGARRKTGPAFVRPPVACPQLRPQQARRRHRMYVQALSFVLCVPENSQEDLGRATLRGM